MARASSLPIKTFSVGFREDRYNELPHARQVARAVRHRAPRAPGGAERPEGPRRAAGRLRRALRRLLGDPDLPRVAPGAAAREGRAVRAMAGTSSSPATSATAWTTAGADLGLLGDLRPRRAPAGPRARSCRSAAARTPSTTSRCRGHGATSIRSRCFPPRALRELLGPTSAVLGVRPRGPGGSGARPPLPLQDLDIKTYLPGDILTKVDRMSMANSLEARVPLLDHQLVEFACRLPADLRMRSGVGQVPAQARAARPDPRGAAHPPEAGLRRPAGVLVLGQHPRLLP